MKIRRLIATAAGCAALVVAAPATANAFSLADLLPTGSADFLFPQPAPPAPAPAPAPQAAAPPAPAPAPAPAPSVGYKNCTEAWNAGVAPLYRDEPGYAPKLDRDDDGIACEVDPR
ncbi:excalibur calcium-binding domain-containing protein [Rhodococcus aetherivorans]|uniref:excalibur calcium-binding domain-containing protein n=1 Tax=Rhodococcus aetherivorans TaxID=191292 RepID=UPI0035EBACAE